MRRVKYLQNTRLQRLFELWDKLARVLSQPSHLQVNFLDDRRLDTIFIAQLLELRTSFKTGDL